MDLHLCEGAACWAIAALAIGAVLAMASGPATLSESTEEAKVGDYTLRGPYTQGNLAVFLILGKEELPGKTFLTLSEALEQKKAVVHETGNVSELSVENLSEDADLFVQSGDIVKGGQQDRLLAVDLILAPKSGRVPIKSFCVEAGRWHRRGVEGVAAFASSPTSAPSRELRRSAKLVVVAGAFPNVSAPAGAGGAPSGGEPQQATRNVSGQGATEGQSKVWQEVALLQAKLGANLHANVRSRMSASSLQLSVEHEKVQEAVKECVAKLEHVVDSTPDAIGYAFAINGQVNSAEVYCSHRLFLQIWPRLLKASALEAVAERLPKGEVKPVGLEAVRAYLADAEKGNTATQDVTPRVRLHVVDNAQTLFLETRDRDQNEVWVHRSFVRK
jgi:hypothetical protein